MFCSVFGSCGGCSAQNIRYETQLENKTNLLRKATGITDIKVFFDNQYNYRNRMDFLFSNDGLSLRKKGKWNEIVKIDDCIIAENRINELMKEINANFSNCDVFDIKRKTGSFMFAVLRVTSLDSSISFVLNEDSLKLSAAITIIKEYALKSTANNILVTYSSSNSNMSVSEDYFVVKGTDKLHEQYLGKTFEFFVQGFFQNNSRMAEKMQKYVFELLSNYDTKGSDLLDLYGGVGTFGIINSGLFKKVTILENVKECIECAENNIKQNNVTNAAAIFHDASKIKNLEFSHKLFVVTDPPRSGMDRKTIEHLNKIKPSVIIYVSCNITQLSKDLPKFKGYIVKSAALFDLFPNTPHLEAVVELVRG